MLAAGYELVYEPAASVYHFHGIHQDDDPGRRRSVVQIMENLGKDWDRPARDTQSPRPPSPGQLNAIALIPVRGDPVFVGDVPLLWYTLEAVRGSEFLRSAVVLTDSEATAELAREIGAEVPFLRPPELSGSLVTVSDVLKFGLQELEHWNIYPDICLVLEETYPFRPVGLADVLISALIREGTDCALAVKAESRSIWVHKGNELSTVSPLIPRSLKSEEFLISLFGLGFATRPANIRDGSLGLEHPFAYRVGEPLAAIELRTKEERDNAVALLSQFWKQHYST